MKCKDCPLCVDDGTYDACGDYDLLCLANWKTQEFPDRPEFFDQDINGCTRSTKWILAQSKEALRAKHAKYDCDCWAEYARENPIKW